VLDQAREHMRQSQVVDGAGAPIGTMSDDRWAQSFKLAVDAGVYPKTMDYERGYTLAFVSGNK
jgi:hypothetical protein